MPPQKIITIGLLLPTNMSFCRNILRGVQAYAHRCKGVKLELVNESGEIPKNHHAFTKLDGLLLFASGPTAIQAGRRCPNLVLLSNRAPTPGIDRVINDDIAIGEWGAREFIRRGFRSLAFVHREGHFYSSERGRGFLRIAEAAGIQPVYLEAFGQRSNVEIVRMMRDLPVPTGVMAANDVTARLLLENLSDAVRLFPSKLALLGVDNDTLHQALCPLPVSSIEPDGVRVGSLALKRVLDRVVKPDLPILEERVPPLRLIRRRSSDAFAVEDPQVVHCLELMEEQLHDLQNVEDVVALMGLGRRSLEKRFRQATGRTLAAELSSLRLQQAQELLRRTDMSMEDIAEEVGLSEARMLWLLFKRETGETPRDFRKRMQEL